MSSSGWAKQKERPQSPFAGGRAQSLADAGNLLKLSGRVQEPVGAVESMLRFAAGE